MPMSAVLGRLAAGGGAPFQERSADLDALVRSLPTGRFLDLLLVGGVIPEAVGCDTTEEKLFAKYADSLVARAFRELGLAADVLGARADAADVLALGGGLSCVADAKSFRLSRTAINQKDFKVEAVHQWKSGAARGCVVGPAFRYPRRSSQIYGQSVRYDVALLSYWHLALLVRAGPVAPGDLAAALNVAWYGDASSAPSYWAGVDYAVRAVAGASERDWDEVRREGRAACAALAAEQEAFHRAEADALAAMDRESLLARCLALGGHAERIASLRAAAADIAGAE